MNTGVCCLSLGQVEHPLELSVIGIVLFISLSQQIEVASSLIYLTNNILSAPNSSDLALFYPHQAATRHNPKTPPMYLAELLSERFNELSFSIQQELYFSSCCRLILLGSGIELGLAMNLAKGFSWDINIIINSILNHDENMINF